jgi:hypothetical protein
MGDSLGKPFLLNQGNTNYFNLTGSHFSSKNNGSVSRSINKHNMTASMFNRRTGGKTARASGLGL